MSCGVLFRRTAAWTSAHVEQSQGRAPFPTSAAMLVRSPTAANKPRRELCNIRAIVGGPARCFLRMLPNCRCTHGSQPGLEPG